MVRPHQSLGGRTPAVAAGMDPIEGFRWREILDLAVARKVTGREVAAVSPD